MMLHVINVNGLLNGFIICALQRRIVKIVFIQELNDVNNFQLLFLYFSIDSHTNLMFKLG